MYHTRSELWTLSDSDVSINFNKCTTLEGDVDNGRSYACVGPGGIWEISVLPILLWKKIKSLKK